MFAPDAHAVGLGGGQDRGVRGRLESEQCILLSGDCVSCEIQSHANDCYRQPASYQ